MASGDRPTPEPRGGVWHDRLWTVDKDGEGKVANAGDRVTMPYNPASHGAELAVAAERAKRISHRSANAARRPGDVERYPSLTVRGVRGRRRRVVRRLVARSQLPRFPPPRKIHHELCRRGRWARRRAQNALANNLYDVSVRPAVSYQLGLRPARRLYLSVSQIGSKTLLFRILSTVHTRRGVNLMNYARVLCRWISMQLRAAYISGKIGFDICHSLQRTS